MISHANCDHPSTKKDRAACRKAQGIGKTHSAKGTDTSRVSVGNRKGRTLTADWDDPNAIGAIDESTLDDRIRQSKVRPAPSPVKVSKVDPSTL